MPKWGNEISISLFLLSGKCIQESLSKIIKSTRKSCAQIVSPIRIAVSITIEKRKAEIWPTFIDTAATSGSRKIR